MAQVVAATVALAVILLLAVSAVGLVWRLASRRDRGAAHVASWRVLVDGEGIHARRWLFGPRDVAWGDVDALSVVMAQRMMAGSVDSVAVMSGGRKAMRISGLVLGGPASQGRFLDEARRRGIPVAPPSELPAGLTPWGPARRRLEALPEWEQVIGALPASAVGFALLLGLVMLVYYLVVGHL